VSQLTPSFIAEIKAALEGSRYSSDDFILDFPKSGRSLAKIAFAYNPAYILQLFEDLKREEIKVEEQFTMTTRRQSIVETVFTVKVAPGKYKIEDSVEMGDLGRFIEQIPKWCENIRSDLFTIGSKTDPLGALRDQLQEYLDFFINAADEYFDSAQLEIVDNRFNELFEQISQLREKYSLTTQQLDNLRKEFTEFKMSARTYPQGMWAKITSNRLVKATAQMINSSEGRTLIAQEIGRALR